LQAGAGYDLKVVCLNNLVNKPKRAPLFYFKINAATCACLLLAAVKFIKSQSIIL
jgi:hypothetical protein